MANEHMLSFGTNSRYQGRIPSLMTLAVHDQERESLTDPLPPTAFVYSSVHALFHSFTLTIEEGLYVCFSGVISK
jgi:hypothetical protein